LDAAACRYAVTPDEHFVIGPHPDYANVILAGGFSGHGFKFCPVIGEIVANLLAGADPGPVDMFSPKRFTSQLTKETR
ncbi:MAG: FAD-dependent oxidoreductase, partial [Candidatus Eremiobacteraeota bacterium]|nr:FAD-dependent oxidoreductase [Candidatus Eremiobacteraeota bacterium]